MPNASHTTAELSGGQMITYTPATAAKALRVSRNRIMAWIRTGNLTAANLGDGTTTRYRITQSAIDDLLDRRAVKPAATRQARSRITARTRENFF